MSGLLIDSVKLSETLSFLTLQIVVMYSIYNNTSRNQVLFVVKINKTAISLTEKAHVSYNSLTLKILTSHSTCINI